MILTGGTDPERIADLARAASASLATYLDGGEVEPILLLAPGEREVPEPVGRPRPGTAFLIRTSGSTTGVGTLVELPWSSLLASIEATMAALGGPAPWLCTLPIHHVAGLQTVLRAVVTAQPSLPYRLGDEVPAGAYLSLVPTQLHQVLAEPDLVRSLRPSGAILVGGQATSSADLAAGRRAGLRLVTTYGMSETCGGCVYDGVPIGSTRLEIREGRIIISGDVVAGGYLGGDAFDGTFVTSDTGTWDGRRLRVTGRIDDAITTGGVTIMPQTIESFVAEQTGIPTIAVGVPDDRWGERVILVASQPVPTSVTGALKSSLGPAYGPKEIVTTVSLGLDGFPLTGSGKVDRRALTEIVRTRGNSG